MPEIGSSIKPNNHIRIKLFLICDTHTERFADLDKLNLADFGCGAKVFRL